MPLTDEDAAVEAIGSFTELSPDQEDARGRISKLLSSNEPFPDVQLLFKLYDALYFRSLLQQRVEVSWSSRLTLCAGICELVRDPANGNKYTRIRLKLSEPLLKYRPRSDVLNTLLHEAIHAYFFITTSWRHARGDDGTGHGSGFLLLADAINNHGGYDITVFHTFHDEVDSYRTHVWQCDGPCQSRPPFFGLVKRSMNRAPGKSDTWWLQHEQTCGGTHVKVSEPALRKDQLEKMSGLKRAGRQRNKIDAWAGSHRWGQGQGHTEDGGERATTSAELVTCPICDTEVALNAINAHLDQEHA